MMVLKRETINYDDTDSIYEFLSGRTAHVAPSTNSPDVTAYMSHTSYTKMSNSFRIFMAT
jgi:hypothetical protein